MTGAEDSGRQAGKPSAHLQREDPPPPAGSMLVPIAPGGVPADCGVEESAGAADPVLEQELAEAEAGLCPEDFTDPRQRAMMRNLAERRHEDEFLRDLAAAGFTGTVWDFFANDLAAYGMPVLMSWTRTGKIVKLCAGKGRPIRAFPEDWTAEDRWWLTAVTVAKAINVFRDRVLRQGVWDPAGGASLKTFFMGLVILQFPNHYNSWYNERLHTLAQPALRGFSDSELAAIGHDRPGSDPARTAIERAHLLEVLWDMPEDLRIACVLMRQGYSVNEAAKAVGKTGKALSQQMSRYRKGKGRRMR